MFYYKLVYILFSGKRKLSSRIYVVSAENPEVAKKKIENIFNEENFEDALSLHNANELPSGPHESEREAFIVAFLEMQEIEKRVKVPA